MHPTSNEVEFHSQAAVSTVIEAAQFSDQGDVPMKTWNIMVKNLGDNDLTLTPQYSADGTTWADCAVGAQTIDARAERVFTAVFPVANEGWYRFRGAGNTWGILRFMSIERFGHNAAIR